ncbi:hypothetical protein DKX38_009511 [Salix brachista]|uniref:Importin subunit beta-1/Transportin-1-like TPR repeats domain-containing protein n=1 Tax=Salix brachista TaxID=2182728 RepID=A0A5N5MAN9_9ROSI|nr:hypothetical protein DKX38_009511 [Salix brachista]
MAGGTCLGLVARTVGDSVVKLVMPFVEGNILKPDWHCREAATYAFGSFLEGRSVETLGPLVTNDLDFLLNAMRDEKNHVKHGHNCLDAYSIVHEEPMLAIGALAHAYGPEFEKYMPELYKYLEMGLQNFEEYEVCAITVGVISDYCQLSYKLT